MPRIRKLDLQFHLKNIKDADGFCLNDSADQEDFGPNRSPRRFCIEIKKSLKPVNYNKAIKFLEKDCLESIKINQMSYCGFLTIHQFILVELTIKKMKY